MRNRFLYIILILFITLIIGAGCTNKDKGATIPHDQGEQYIPVEVSEVGYKTLSNKATINGKVSADKDLMIVPTIPGKVQSIKIKNGDQVNKGDILFTLDDKDIRKQVDQAKIGYEMAKVNYNISQEQVSIARNSFELTKALKESILEEARENLENTKRLYEVGAVSKSQLDQAKLGLLQQEAQMQAQVDQAKLGASDQVMELAKIQLEQAELAYKQAQDVLNDAKITSPINGIVTGISIEEGGMASNSQPAMTIIDMDRVYIRIDVVEGIINRIWEGQEVDITIPVISSNTFKAVIDSISPTFDAKTQLYPIEIYLDNKDGKIKPGMFANVEISLDIKDKVLSIPSQAIIVRDEKNLVYIVENNKAIEKEVEIGLDIGTEVEVINGLAEGDIVIITGHNYVKDGGNVKIVGGAN